MPPAIELIEELRALHVAVNELTVVTAIAGIAAGGNHQASERLQAMVAAHDQRGDADADSAVRQE